MKLEKILIAGILFLTLSATAQDTTYVMKDGFVVDKYAVNVEFDSIIPYRPEMDINNLLDAGTEISHLIDSGLSVKELLDAGLEASDLIGEYYQGGIIFYVNDTTGQGYVCANEDLDSDYSYSRGAYYYINTLSDSGIVNTNTIVSTFPTENYAAHACVNLVHEGYDDWFLPSFTELSVIYANRAAINTAAVASGGSEFIPGGYYWSSNETDYDDYLAFSLYFANGSRIGSPKGNNTVVRPIRHFKK